VSLHFGERAHLPRGKVLLLTVVGALSIPLGAKILFLLEQHVTQGALVGDLHHGYRLPGGILLLGLAVPLAALAAGVHPRRFCDAFAPAVALAVVLIRIGCFLNGCCFGMVTEGPMGVRFPPGSLAYETQIEQNAISFLDSHSLPLHPLQLYMASVAAALFWMTLRLSRRELPAGVTWLTFTTGFALSTAALEFVRETPLYLNVTLSLAAGVTCLSVLGILLLREGQGGS
jgi:phosphatidylglycerol:prolipoprotein diacylglycerol transferase